jgi:hypothetical protein
MGALTQISKVLASGDDGSLLFDCPGCGMAHQVMTGAGSGPRWGYNGNAEAPTFTPSILVRWHQWEPPAYDLGMAERIRRGEITQVKVEKVCHSFVTDGQIQFLGDCTHALAGQTVPLKEWDLD